MREKLTHLDTLSLKKVKRIGGDLLLLPRQQNLPKTEDFLQVIDITARYKQFRLRHRREPGWIKKYPLDLQVEARYNYAIHEEEPLGIMNIFRNTGISYMIKEGRLCEALHQTFGLQRLQSIRQLGFLQAPWFGDVKIPSPLSEHNRLMHSYDVMAIATLIGYNVNLSRSWFNTLRTAALTHDMGTPAGGDSVKLVDLKALDEDHNYGRLLSLYPNRKHLWRKYRISEKLLIATVQGKGMLGKLLDIADKLAYVARDLWACESFIYYGEKYLNQQGLRTLLSLLEEHPNPCALWDSVEVEDGQPMITNPTALRTFLKIRTLLFRELYYHPHARFGEYLVSRLLVKALYEQGKVTRDELVEMRDYDLEGRLTDEYPIIDKSVNWKPVVEIMSEGAQCKSFRDLKKAKSFYRHLKESGKVFVLLEDTRKAIIKTGVHLPVATPEGPKAFRKAFPEEAKEIEEMALIAPMVHVYYLGDESYISGEKLQEIAGNLGNP